MRGIVLFAVFLLACSYTGTPIESPDVFFTEDLAHVDFSHAPNDLIADLMFSCPSKADDPCCIGNTCAAGFVCDEIATVCVPCGHNGDGCCGTDATKPAARCLDKGDHCRPIEPMRMCDSCGAEGQACCSVNALCDGELRPYNGDAGCFCISRKMSLADDGKEKRVIRLRLG